MVLAIEPRLVIPIREDPHLKPMYMRKMFLSRAGGANCSAHAPVQHSLPSDEWRATKGLKLPKFRIKGIAEPIADQIEG
jgi:hypothetical protein